MAQPPAYQWYPGDALSSSKIQRMTLEEEGAYRRLLDFQWMDGFIPADIGELSRMCKSTPRKMALIWDKLRTLGCFQPTTEDPDKLVNLKMEDVRRRQQEHRQAQSQSGSKGAEKRWQGHKQNDGKAIKTPMAKNGSSSPSSSSSSDSESPQPPSGAFVVTENHFDATRAKYPAPGRKRRKLALRYYMASVKTEQDVLDADAAVENYVTEIGRENARNAVHGRPPRPWMNDATFFNNWRDWIPEVQPVSCLQCNGPHDLNDCPEIAANIARLEERKKALEANA